MKTLLMIDVQNDFINGTLQVPNAIEIIPFINSIADNYDLVVATMDWHPTDHIQFASNQKGKNPFETMNINGNIEVLWPDHCVQNTLGAAPHKDLRIKVDKYFYKGKNKNFHPYGGFENAGETAGDELHKFIQENNVNEFDVVGLATDYCVKVTVLGALELRYVVNVLTNGIRAVVPENAKDAIEEMKKNGANII